MLRLRTLGSATIENATGPLSGAPAQRKALALFAFLGRAGDRGVSRDRILAHIWPEAPADRAAHRLAQLLYVLRRELGADDLFLGSSDLRLNQAVLATDIAEFESALASDDLEKAVGAYGGPFLDGFYLDGADEFERWAEVERSDLARRYAAAVEALAVDAAGRSDAAGAVRWWGKLAQADPLNARVTVSYMEALAAAGDRAGALRFAREHEARLREEYETEPDAAVVAAGERLRAAPPEPIPIAAPSGPSIAVLPFVNLSPDRDNEYFSDGMSEELINELARTPGLRVASRTSSFTFKGKDADIHQIGARLGVGAVVEGSVRKVGDRIRLAAQLIDVASGYHLWSESYDRTLCDVFALQTELARAIVRSLPLKVGGDPPPVRPPTAAVEAYTLYLRGRFFAVKRTPADLRVAIEYFEQAVERDAGYALAHAGLAECWALLGFEEFGDMPAREAMPRAKAAAARALELDPKLAEAHTWRGVIAMLYDWDWEEAEREFRLALELAPAYALGHAWYAVFLGAMQRHDEASARILQAEALDPLSLTVQLCVGRILWWAGRYHEAAQRLRAIAEMAPDNSLACLWLARAYIAGGQLEAARAEAERGLARNRVPWLIAIAGHAYARLGRPDDAERMLHELRALAERQHVAAAQEAELLGGLGDVDEAVRCYEAMWRERGGYMPFVAVYHGLQGLPDSDPRYQELIRRMRLAP